MKAAIYRAFGPAEKVLKVEEIDTPTPGPDEVCVAIHLSGVNPSDVKARAGARAGVTELPFPAIIPHSDGAGVITAVGENVDPARIGSRVWVWNGQWGRAFGTCAEHIVLPAAQAVEMPDSMTFETGAALGIPGLTACHTVFSGGEVTGKTVLIQGGAGTVGYLAVQLARWGGARVIATAGAADLDRVAAAGAETVLEYRRADLAEAILAANDGHPVDHIVEVEFGANADTDAAVIAPNGRIVGYGSARDMTPRMPFYPLMFKAVTLELALIYLLPEAPRAAAIDRLHRAAADGALTCPVDAVFSLQDSAAAHKAVETGGRSGSVLVRMPGASA